MIRSLKFLFTLWLVIAVVTLGSTGLAMRGQLADDPRRVIIVVDSSFEAGKDWDFILAQLNRIGEHPYTKYNQACTFHTISTIVRSKSKPRVST